MSIHRRHKIDWGNLTKRWPYEVRASALVRRRGRSSKVLALGVGKFGFPAVVTSMPDEKEHRRQIAEKVNQLLQGKLNVYIDATLTAGATTTTLTDARIGYFSTIAPSMALTANGAAAIVAGIWVSGQKTGSCTLNHASNAATDQSIRFNILG